MIVAVAVCRCRPVWLFGTADAVYLARWSDAPVSRSSIQDNLPKIKSRRTRVAECLTRVAPVSCCDWGFGFAWVMHGLDGWLGDRMRGVGC